MDNLRWILIFAGVAILVLLWVSGRSGRREAARGNAPDPLLGDGTLGEGFGDGFEDGFDDRFGDGFGDGLGYQDPGDADDFARPGAPAAAGAPGSDARNPAGSGLDAGASGRGHDRGHERRPERGQGALSRTFDSLSERFGGQRVRAAMPTHGEVGESPTAPAAETKIVALHVVAPAGEILPPEALRDLLERRGYHHGAMSIYHSLFEGTTVYSVARMVKPGTFDLDDLSTFETPGLAMILQLPGPVEPDFAFEVMLREAFEIADELGGAVLDGNRSTLGGQTQQHLREEIHQYMHRQKYDENVA